MFSNNINKLKILKKKQSLLLNTYSQFLGSPKFTRHKYHLIIENLAVSYFYQKCSVL